MDADTPTPKKRAKKMTDTSATVTQAPKKRGPKAVSASHKEAMQSGRTESKAVREYLEALEAHRPKRGRKRTAESVQKRLEAIESLIEEASPLDRLSLAQERMDLTIELESLEAGDNLAELEEAFVEVASAYGERKGISYFAWREVGVDAAVLKRAGVGR